MVLSDEEITRLFRIRKTVMQMLRDRGYIVSDFEIDMSKHQFLSKYGENTKREDLVIIKDLRSNPSEKVYFYVIFLFLFHQEFSLSKSCYLELDIKF